MNSVLLYIYFVLISKYSPRPSTIRVLLLYETKGRKSSKKTLNLLEVEMNICTIMQPK